jgi:beta-lactamase class C
MPGSEIGIFGWDAAGQVYSSARDMAAFLAAAMGELPGHAAVQDALRFARQPIFEVNPHFTMALTWQRTRNGPVTIVDKNGGLPNTSTYLGLIPERRVGIVILCNRGKVPATAIGRRVLMRLVAADEAQSRDGVDGESADIDDGN